MLWTRLHLFASLHVELVGHCFSEIIVHCGFWTQLWSREEDGSPSSVSCSLPLLITCTSSMVEFLVGQSYLRPQWCSFICSYFHLRIQYFSGSFWQSLGDRAGQFGRWCDRRSSEEQQSGRGIHSVLYTWSCSDLLWCKYCKARGLASRGQSKWKR